MAGVSGSLRCFALACLSVLLLAGPLPAASVLDTLGTDFWLAIPNNERSDSLSEYTPYLFVTGNVATTGTVEIPGMSFIHPFSVTPGIATQIDLPTSAMVTIIDGIEEMGIHVTTGEEVTVYLVNRKRASTDACLAYPTDVLGTRYLALSYRNWVIGLSGIYTQLVMVGTRDATSVTITLPVSTGVRTAGVPYTITLDQGQVYSIEATALTDDLTGADIGSDQPLVVYGTHGCVLVPMDEAACDHLLEQVPPEGAWGQRFVTMPLATRLSGDTFRVLASQDGTSVNLNGTVIATLNRGEFWEGIVTVPSYFESDRPVLVAQYSNCSTYDGVTTSDPFMLYIPPYEQFMGQYTVAVPLTGFSINYINVTAPSAAVGSIILDGSVLSAGLFAPIGSTGYSGAQVPILPGSHQLTGTYPFGVYVYGYDSYDSYGYAGGFTLGMVASVAELVLEPPTAERLIGDSHCVTATLRDSEGEPVPGIRVDFSVTGVHGRSGFSYTDASGAATFCYAGTLTGTDSIRASMGSFSDTVTCDWFAFTPTPTATPTITFTPTITDTPTATGTPTSDLNLYVWPNPFIPSEAAGHTLKFSVLPQGAEPCIYTVSGELVKKPKVIDRRADWDGRNEKGSRVSGGVYYYVVRRGGEVIKSGKIVYVER